MSDITSFTVIMFTPIMSSIDMIKSILRVNFDIESKKDIIPCSMWAFLKNIVTFSLIIHNIT